MPLPASGHCSDGDFQQAKQQVGKQQNADAIYNGIPFGQYKRDLAEKEHEIRQLIAAGVHKECDLDVLKRELAQVQKLRQDEKVSYQAHIQDLQERIARLDQLAGQVPDKLIEQAKNALAKGDTQAADQLFQQVENQAEPHIQAAAEAAYQRGELAKDDIRYQGAWQHYQRAVQLAPDNSLYLNEAGVIAYTLAKYRQAVAYFGQALKIDLKAYGGDNPAVARDRNNLGGVLQTLGEYPKAIAYLEQALPVLEQKLGLDHPNTQAVRNNLQTARRMR